MTVVADIHVTPKVPEAEDVHVLRRDVVNLPDLHLEALVHAGARDGVLGGGMGEGGSSSVSKGEYETT